MTAKPAESETMPRRLWFLLIALVLTGQVGFIFWLGGQNPLPSLMPRRGTQLSLPADQTSDLPGVSDPTLFVLPGVHSFSRSAWMDFAQAKYELDPWSELPRPLPLAIPQLGATLMDFVLASQPRPFELVLKPEPEISPLGYLPLDEAQSTYEIEGGLAGRRLLTPFTLVSWPAPDILLPTEVQIAVDAAGRVFSASLITNSASAEANAFALNLARTARFSPLRWVGERPPPPAPRGLSWGKILFRWHTVARTNSPAIPAAVSAK